MKKILIILTIILMSSNGFGSVYAEPIPKIDKDAINIDTVWHATLDGEVPCTDTPVTGLASNSPGGSIEGYPIRLPFIKDGNKLAEAIDKFIVSSVPNSPLVGKGKYIVQGGMRAGINPIMVVAQARMESGLGTKVPAGSFNSFGRKASNRQPRVASGSSNWYAYPSWEKSFYADAYPASSFDGSTGGPAQPDDQFQYIMRVYGKNLDSGFKSFLAGGNGVSAYAPEAENNVSQYVTNVLKWSDEIAALAGDAVDLKTAGAAGGSTTATTTAPAVASGSKQTTVALDPGHGAVVPEYTDPITGLGDRETDNSPEREDVQEIANQIKAGLEKTGYKVVMLKTNAADAISKRQRVDAAKAASADIGISHHTSPDSGSFGKWGEVWPQFVGGYRESSKDSSKKVTFSNTAIAAKSDQYTTTIAAERDKIEGGGAGKIIKKVGQDLSFGRSRGLPSFGNLSLMQLWSDTIPWVYNESGSSAAGLSAAQKSQYAEGIINGVQKALPPTGTTTTELSGCNTSSSGGNGNVVATILSYAWPDYRGHPYVILKPEYSTAVNAAKSAGRYVGGGRYPGVDCGGFVTTVMVDSGFEPGYNYTSFAKNGAGATPSQLSWLRKNWQSLGRGNKITTASLQPGDVAQRVTSSGSSDGHTFMFIGTQPGFGSSIASASYSTTGESWRSPMAGKESPTASDIEWFRKK